MADSKFSQLEKAIIRTVCYYNIFDYPLTAEEIWRWLYADEIGEFNNDLNSVIEALELNRSLKEVLDYDEGYYFLKGRREIVETRRERREIAAKKMKIAKNVVSYLRLAPFLKYVAVCNNLAFGNSRKESDIDLLVVMEKGRLWAGRFFVTALVHLLGRRRHKNKIKDRICLSFFVTTEALDFQPLLLAEGDPYFNFWVSQLVPLYDEEDYHQKIQKANGWVLKKMPNAFGKESSPLVKNNSYLALLSKLFSLFFTNSLFGENLSRSLKQRQAKKMQKNEHSVMHEDNTKVIISDNVLKFHEADRREKYREAFFRRTNEILGEGCG